MLAYLSSKPSNSFPTYHLEEIKLAVKQKLDGRDDKVADTYSIIDFKHNSTLLKFKQNGTSLFVSISKYTSGTRPKRTFVGKFMAEDLLKR